jgi:hypothetical protein
LNGGHRACRIRHLDQGTLGISFRAPVGDEAFWSVLGAVLADHAKGHGRVSLSLGRWRGLLSTAEGAPDAT